MYGLINKALKTMISDGHGTEVWEMILHKSAVPEDSFTTMQQYNDDITYALVDATSEILETPAAVCLELFGHYWATVTAPNAYEMLFQTTGENLFEFLDNVNSLHDRITSTFIGYIPPHFITTNDKNKMELVYESQREGLTPFLIGIIKGLADRFEVQVKFESVIATAVDQGETSVITMSIV
jgi:guanylate cyclase soluble subunit beta